MIPWVPASSIRAIRMNSPLAGRAMMSETPTRRPHQLRTLRQAVAVVLHVHPDAVKAHQAYQLE